MDMRKFFLILSIFSCLISIGQSPMKKLIRKIAIDADATTYINAVEAAGRTLTDAEKGYINTYIVGLKSAGIWDKIYDRGLPIWGTAAPSLLTLKGIATLTAINSPTFSSTGVDFNGTNQYITTNIIPSTALSLTSTHISYYSQEDVLNTNTDMGCVSSTNRLEIYLRHNTTGLTARIWATGSGQITTTAPGTSMGYFMATRVSGSDLRLIFNGSQTGSTVTSTAGARPTNAIYIGCRNLDGSPSLYSNHNCSMWSVGSGLTLTEAANDNTLTEAFMDSMGIGVE